MPKGKYDHSKIRGRKKPEHSLKLKELANQGKHPFQRSDRKKQAKSLKKRYQQGLKNPMSGRARPDVINRNKRRNQQLSNPVMFKSKELRTVGRTLCLSPIVFFNFTTSQERMKEEK